MIPLSQAWRILVPNLAEAEIPHSFSYWIGEKQLFPYAAENYIKIDICIPNFCNKFWINSLDDK